MELISFEELSDIFEVSVIINEVRHGAFQIHTIRHPKLGEIKTIQCDGNEALLFK